MADEMRITNLPSAGTPAAVAIDLAKLILVNASDSNNRKQIYGQDNVLKVYSDCLKAARGDYEYNMAAL